MKNYISHGLGLRRSLALLALIVGLVPLASAQAILNFEGQTPDAKYESQSDLKLSLLAWSPAEEQEATLAAWRSWQDTGDANVLLTELESHNTRGYLFTGEVTGYAIKYAFQDTQGDASLLIVPGLKTKNRYMWEPAAALDAPPFTLLRLEWQGEEKAVLKSSLDVGMQMAEDGSTLDVGAGAAQFGMLEDATPYYLEEAS